MNQSRFFPYLHRRQKQGGCRAAPLPNPERDFLTCLYTNLTIPARRSCRTGVSGMGSARGQAEQQGTGERFCPELQRGPPPSCIFLPPSSSSPPRNCAAAPSKPPLCLAPRRYTKSYVPLAPVLKQRGCETFSRKRKRKENERGYCQDFK